MTDSIFTRIIKGEIPAHRVYEDEHVLGFLDIHPVTPGHTLLVTKKQVEQFTELSPKDYGRLMGTAQRLAQHMQKTLGCQRVVLRIEGFDVPHVHVHLIPCSQEHDSFKEGRDQIEPDHNALNAMAAKLSQLT